MAGPVPIVHRKAGETAVASYDFTDIAEGTGAVQYYGLESETSGAASANAADYIIAKTITFADNYGGDGLLTAAEGEVDFDTTEFNLPRTVKGTMYLTGTIKETDVGSTKFVVKHVDADGTVTVLGTVWTGQQNDVRGFLVPIAISETLFKKGDRLRISATVTGGGGGSTGLNLDAEDATYKPFKIWIPFKIDL